LFFFLSKIIAFLIQPLVWVFILMLLAFFRKTLGRKLLLASVILLYFFSNEFIFNEVSRLYESRAVKIETLNPPYSAAIVLGGLSSFQETVDQLEFQGSADRLLDILPFYFEGMVSKLIIAGGSGRLNQEVKESPRLKDYLISLGVKETDILIEDKSRNTYENAIYAKELIEQQDLRPPFLLCTSASHMPRSLAVFEKQAINVDAYPVDFYTLDREFNPDRLLIPKAHILQKWDWLVHEWLGWIFYKLAGYC